MAGVLLTSLEKKGAKYCYRGRWWELNKPVKSTNKNKKMMVLAKKKVDGEWRVKVVHFGALGYGHNYSAEAKRNYLRRSAWIRNASGELTKDDPWSANHWARKVLWPKDRPATGPKKTRKAA